MALHSTLHKNELALQSQRLLVVEPDHERQTLLRGMLADTPFKAHMVATARQAIHYCRSEVALCALLSDALPDLESLALISQLRDRATLTPIPVVLLTQSRDDQQTLTALRCGASDVIAWDRVTKTMLVDRLTAAADRVMLINALAHHRLANELTNLELTRRQQLLAGSLDDHVHALRTPLAAIQEFLSLVLDGVGGVVADRHGKFLALARGACATLDREIGRLHDLSDLSKTLDDGRYDAVATGNLLELVQNELSLEAQFADVHLGIAYCDDLPTVRADALQISQVLTQLTAAGIRVVGPGGRVTLMSEAVKGTMRQRMSVHLTRSLDNVVELKTALGDDFDASPLAHIQLHGFKQILEGHETELHVASLNGDAAVISFELTNSDWRQ